jgi:trimeric autotransporter adhesin
MASAIRLFLSPQVTKLQNNHPANGGVWPRAARRLIARGHTVSIVCALLLMMGATNKLNAQARDATITGTIADSTGAVVPEADVIVTETATGVSYPTKSDGVGLYVSPYLAAGDYSVTITKAGFKTFTVRNIHLDSAQTVREDVKLTIGATTTQVEVNAETLHINTEDGALVGSVPAAVIDEIPNVSNNPFQYAELQNGVIPSSSTQVSVVSTSSGLASSISLNGNDFGLGVNGRTTFAAFGVDGGQPGMNNIMIDGLPIMGGGYNDPTVLTNLEGIQSLQVVSNSNSAEYGRGSGQLSITTKSGTNKYHGLVEYQNRNEAFMANTAAAKFNHLITPANPAYLRQPYKVNDIGGDGEGPILKDRLFFFGSLHYLTHNFGTGFTLHVPTALERTGDFGASLIPGSNGQPTPVYIYNPFSATPVTGATNVYQRTEFPHSTNCGTYTDTTLETGNMCGDRITGASPYGLYILSQYPMPNTTPSDPYNDNNYTARVVATFHQYTNSERIDYKRGRHSIYGSGGLQWDLFEQPNEFGSGDVANFNDIGATSYDRNYYAQIGDTIVFSPSLFVDMRYGATRDHTAALGGRTSGFTNYAQMGISTGTQSIMVEPGAAPVVAPTSGAGPAPSQGTWSSLTPYSQFNNKQEHQVNQSANGSVTKVKGSITFKAGAQLMIILHNYNDFEEAAANLGGCCANDQTPQSYSSEYVSALGVANNSSPYNIYPQQQGYPGALTLVNEGVWFVRPGANLRPGYESKYFALYSQNDWKVTRKLTLNLGVRWELQPGITEKFNRLAGYDFTALTPLAASLGFPNMRGAVDFPGTMGYSRNLWDTEWNNWTPHLGFAYRVMPNVVARGGFAINYEPSNTGFYSSPNDYGEATWTTGNTGSLTYGLNPNGIPTETINQAAPQIVATGSNTLAPQTYGVAEAYFNRHFQNAIDQNYNFTVETSFGSKGQWLGSAGYVGSRENHLFTRNLAFENIQNLSVSQPNLLQSWRSTYISSNGTNQQQTAQVTNPYQPVGGPLIPLQNSLASATIQQYIPYLPYPLLFGGDEDGSHGFGSYDSLQVHLGHKTNSLYLDANYTWSKSLGFVNSIVASGNISSLDLLCNRCNRNYNTTDIPNRFVVSGIYQLPFNEGQRWAPSNPVARQILGGWSLSPIFLVQDGTPVILSGLSGQFTGRINYAGAKGDVPLRLPSSFTGHRFVNATTKVTLPCGIVVTPSLGNKLKFNPCAFSGPVVTGANGTTILTDEYWYGNGNQTNGNIRSEVRFNTDLTLRKTFNLTERYKLDISADATNVTNTAEWSSSPSGTIGATDTVNNLANGQIPGLPSANTGYGSWGLATYDPRQIEFVGRITF